MALCRWPSTIQARRAAVPMPSWNSSAVHDGKLYTNRRRCQSSTPAVRQWAEGDRSVVSTGQQLWSLLFHCCGGIRCQTVAHVTQLWVSAFSGVTWKHTFLRIIWRDILRMQLHWLPVRQCVYFKVASFVHQSSGIAPSYLADDYRLVADTRERRLRSTASRTCVVTRTYSTFGDRSFSAARPGLWNSLPSHLKLTLTYRIHYNEFRRSLTTFLFGQWSHGAVWTLLV